MTNWIAVFPASGNLWDQQNANAVPPGGQLFGFNLTGNRRMIAVDDLRLEDRVADHTAKRDVTGRESLLFGSGFGVGTDTETGLNGNPFLGRSRLARSTRSAGSEGSTAGTTPVPQEPGGGSPQTKPQSALVEQLRTGRGEGSFGRVRGSWN